MKRILALILPMVICLSLCACKGNEAPSVDDLIADAPSITGVITEVHDKYIVVQGEPNELYHLSEEYHVSLPAEYEDPHASYSVGDEVIVYYDGNIAESDPLQINRVLAIEWKNRAENSDVMQYFFTAKVVDLIGELDLINKGTYYEEVDGSQIKALVVKVVDIGNSNLSEGAKVEVWADGCSEFAAGDEVIVYYDGNILESDPLQVNGVLAIEWKNHAENTDISDPDTVPSKIPELTVAYDDTSFAAWLGGHSWVYANDDGTKNAITADSNHPLECTEAMPFIPVYATTVSHAVGFEPAQVTLQFDIEPDKLTVYRYDLDAADDTEGEEIIMDNGYILDLAFGNYLYHIIPEWSFPDDLGGSGDFAFYTKAPTIENGDE